MHDYKSLREEVMICAFMVNTQTDRDYILSAELKTTH